MTLDRAVVNLLVELESKLLTQERSQEVQEYRRGYKESLTGLKNGAAMGDVIDALRELGWCPPTKYWVSPPVELDEEAK